MIRMSVIENLSIMLLCDDKLTGNKQPHVHFLLPSPGIKSCITVVVHSHRSCHRRHRNSNNPTIETKIPLPIFLTQFKGESFEIVK